MPRARRKKHMRKKKDHIISYEEREEEEEFVYDEITGGRMKKPVMSVLNKTKLSKYEMDDLFNELG